MSSFLNDIEQNSPDAVRRLFSTQEPPDTAAIPATVIAHPAAAEDDADPRTPLPDQREIIEDRRRLGDLEQEVHKYRCLLDEVNLHMAAQQAAHDDAMATSHAQSQTQINQLLAALAATTAAQQITAAGLSDDRPANLLAATAAATAARDDGLPSGSQQGDCPAAADNTGRPDRPENITAAAHNDLNAPSLAADADTARSKEDQTPVLPEQGDQLLLRHSDSAVTMARGCNSAADALLCWIDFLQHDVQLNSTKGKRITTNCASLWAYVQDERPDLTGAFIAGISCPGHAAHLAAQDFTTAITSWLRPQAHTLTGLIVAGMTYDRDSHAASETKDLVKISVRSDDIDSVIAAVERDGFYTRELCGKGNIADEPGFSRFDPDTSLGQLSWSQLRRLLFTRLKQPACRATEIRMLRDLWLQHIQGSTAADKFFSSDETKYELYETAGGSYPDNLRIEVTKPRLSPNLLLAFEAFQEMEMCRGAYNPMLEEDWTTFSAAAIRVGISLLQKSESIAAVSGASPVAPAAPADQRQRNMMPISPEIKAAGSGCWKWSHVGVCSYGDNCRFPHLGTAGAQTPKGTQWLMRMDTA